MGMAPNSYVPILTIPNYWGWTAYTPVIPKLYWDVYSQEERIKKLCLEYDKLTHYVSMLADNINKLPDYMEDVQAKLDELKKYVDSQDDTLDEKWQETLANVKDGALLWDVTLGRYNDGIQTMRNLFNDLTLHSLSCDTIAETDETVDEVSDSGLNTRGWAVYAGYLDPELLPDGVGYVAPPPDDVPLDVATLATAQIDDGYFVTQGLGDDDVTTRKLATARVDDNHVREGD